jgi:hypothetical protein
MINLLLFSLLFIYFYPLLKKVEQNYVIYIFNVDQNNVFYIYPLFKKVIRSEDQNYTYPLYPLLKKVEQNY